MSATTAETILRDPPDPSVVVVDGYGVALTVSRGHLIIRDGIGRHRRERRLPRAQRTVRRLVILGHTGHISLEAIRWCHDTGVTVTQLEPDGTLLLSAGGTGRDDARLRRSQALAATNATGLLIARELLTAKLHGQATVLQDYGLSQQVATAISQMTTELSDAPDLAYCLDLESRAANLYFGAWTGTVMAKFAARELPKVPDHWVVFAARGSILHRGGRSPRSAADPINALLNYGYALLEAEAQLAVRALGLDPGLGVMHTDKPSRDSLALDVMEPARPYVDRRVLELLATRRFAANDFHETRQGTCRLMPALTHQLAAELPHLARQVAISAESVVRHLAQGSAAPIEVRTPLTQSRKKAAQARGERSRKRQAPEPPKMMPTCHSCGVELSDRRRKLCTACWNVTRRELAAQRLREIQQAATEKRAEGIDPSHSPQARAKRADSLRRWKEAEKSWVPAADESDWTAESFISEILPALQHQPLSAIQEATGVSNSSASRIRRGAMTPHRRHWAALLHLAER